MWAVGWVGSIPANVGATANYVSMAKAQPYWVDRALRDVDEDIRSLTSEIVKAGFAKEYVEGADVEGEEIRLVITEKMKESLSKQVPFERLIARCPKCRDYLLKMEKAGVPTDIALESLRSRLSEEMFGKGYASFEECVDDNSDKDDPDAFCAWLKRENPGACKQGGTAKDEVTEIVRLAQSISSLESELGRVWAAVHQLEEGKPGVEGVGIALSKNGQATPHGGGVTDKEGVTMTEGSKETKKDNEQTPPPTGEGKKGAPNAEDYLALIKAQEVEIANLRSEVEGLKASKGDFAKMGEDMKKGFEDWSKKFSELSERVLGIEGKIGQPAGSGKSRGQSPPDGTDGEKPVVDWDKVKNPNDLLALIAKQ